MDEKRFQEHAKGWGLQSALKLIYCEGRGMGLFWGFLLGVAFTLLILLT